MKKNKIVGIIAIACIAVLCVTLLASCKGVKLTVPKDIKYDNGTFSWNAVVGADGYMVSVNDDSKEIYVTTASVSAFDPQFKDSLVDKEVNTLNVRAVTLDNDGKVEKSSKIARYEFDYATPVETAWTVTFDLNYANAPQAQTIDVKRGDKFDRPTTPIRLGWTFAGWYRDSQCLVAASFTPSGESLFNVTADMTLYAKWTESDPVSTTAIYYYSDSWTQVAVKPYKGETELFQVGGITMVAVAGKANWYKADIADTATSVIFTNGEDSTDSATFDKTKPYCKDGVWTATMPTEQPVDPDSSVCIKVGNGVLQQLNENPEVAGEYMIDLTLEIGDTVVITIDGKTVSNYDERCSFKGTATIKGEYSFYVTTERIWVEVPQEPSAAFIIINGDTENAVGMRKNSNPSDESIEIEYSVTVTLEVGDKVKIIEGNFEHKNYEHSCGFTGTATVEGSYTFYAKRYKDGGDSVWVAVPRNTEVTTTSTKVYFHNNAVSNKWTSVYLYCWNGTTQGNNKSWPGVKMTALGNDWFMLEIEAGFDMIIFNNGSGGTGNQTADLVLVTADGYAYYDVNGVTTDRPAE